MLMAAATVVFLMPVTVEARRGHRSRVKRRDKRDGPAVRPAANRTRADAPLFRFAVYSDAHYWRPSKVSYLAPPFRLQLHGCSWAAPAGRGLHGCTNPLDTAPRSPHA